MSIIIRELRESTGMTQKVFADMYGIPLSTLRKWEQGEAQAAPYIITLLAKTLPSTDVSLRKVVAGNGDIFYCDNLKKIVFDSLGNQINVTEDLDNVKEANLGLYLSELFEDFYEIQNKFNRDCKFDKDEDILWV